MARRTPASPAFVVAVCAGLAAGCSSPIVERYEARRAEILADPGPAPAGWRPDGRLHLSPALVDDVVQAGLQTFGTTSGETRVTGPLGVRGDVSWDATVRRVDLAASERCERCIEVDARIRADVAYRFGPARGTTPVTVRTVLDVRVDAEADRDGAWTVTLVPQDVQTVEITIRDLAVGVRRAVEDRLTRWAREELLARMEPIPVGTFGGDALPIRALTVEATDGGGLTIDFLTRSPTGEPLGETAPKIRDGYQLDMSQRSLIGLAARASFDAGPVSYDVVVEPTALDIGPVGFSMGLRLWRPKGRGWWRDYRVTGDLEISNREIVLTPTAVEEVAQSRGAVLADPLAAVAEGRILSTIEDSVNTTLPSFQEAEAQGMRVLLSVENVRGSGGILRVRGDVDVETGVPSRRERPAGGMGRPR